jgi:hypothetical protein
LLVISLHPNFVEAQLHPNGNFEMELADGIQSVGLAQQTKMPLGRDHLFAPFRMMGKK